MMTGLTRNQPEVIRKQYNPPLARRTRHLRLLWFALLSVVIFGSLLPGDSLIMQTLARWNISDKLEHFGAYLALAWLPAIHENRRFAWLCAAGLMIVGLGLELAQINIPGRSASLADALADALGIGAGMAAAYAARSSLHPGRGSRSLTAIRVRFAQTAPVPDCRIVASHLATGTRRQDMNGSLRAVSIDQAAPWIRVIVTSLTLIFAYLLIYPRAIDLSGDQTAQVVAAESLLSDGTYRVSLHEAYGDKQVVELGADLRQSLRWFPPGYSLLLFALSRCGLSMAMAALVVHYATKFMWAMCWLAAGTRLGVSFADIACAVTFLFFLTYPSTTTDLFESIATALVLLALSHFAGRRTGAGLASISITIGLLLRFATVKLAAFFSLVELVRRPTRQTLVRVSLSLAPAAIVYLLCTWMLSGDSSPYHHVGPVSHTAWRLLPKGIYYAVTGGWSPANVGLKIAVAAFLVVAGTGLVHLYRKTAVPDWIALLIAWQGFCLLFLIVVQLRYGSMYAPGEPAFVTPRFFTLAQPLNVSALLLLAPLSIPALRTRLRITVMALLLVCMLDWIGGNYRILRDRTPGADGFLRPNDLASIHRVLQSRRLEAIFNAAGVFTYTATDPRIIYPDNIRGFHAPKDGSIAVVRFAGDPNRLSDALKKSIPAVETQRIGTFEVEFFDLPKGFELFLEPSTGD